MLEYKNIDVNLEKGFDDICKLQDYLHNLYNTAKTRAEQEMCSEESMCIGLLRCLLDKHLRYIETGTIELPEPNRKILTI